MPLNVEDKFREELNSLLAQGIITESDSHWCSPPLPVRKKDGSIRIVVDYRKLNQVTEDEPFYMPSTEEILARLGAAHYLSKLDLAKGFHQIPMAEESSKYTAFACKFGKLEYLKMPFGLKNAPATFQLLMQRCLAGLEAFSSPYIDDIIVYSSDWSCHMFHIAQVLSRLQSHGLTIKISKCLWGCRQFEFLGLIVGNGKLSIPESRVDKFKSFVMPKNQEAAAVFSGHVQLL